jgi:hypothetical protein
MALKGIQNIRQFGNIIRDMSRPYLFLISIPYLDRDERVTAFARSTKIPQYKISTKDIAFQTQKWRIASTAEFDGSWDVEFLCDEGHSIRNKLIGWMQKAYDPSIMRNGAPIEYKTDNVKVVQLDRSSNAVVQYQFVGLFPSMVGDIQLAHEGDEPEKFTCTFTYDYWTMAGAGASATAANFFLGISVETGNSGVSISTASSIATKIGTFGVNTSSVI